MNKLNWHVALDFLPVILAIACIVLSAMKITALRRKNDIIAMSLSIIASMLMIIAQLSWWTSALSGNYIGTQLADNIWLIFNTLVMIVFIMYGAPARKSNDYRTEV